MIRSVFFISLFHMIRLWSLFPCRSVIVISVVIGDNCFIISWIGDCYLNDRIWSFTSLFTLPFTSQFATWFVVYPNIRTYITHCITCSLTRLICSCIQGFRPAIPFLYFAFRGYFVDVFAKHTTKYETLAILFSYFMQILRFINVAKK